MARHFGYLIEQGPGGVLQERDTATCGHCQHVMILPPPKDGHLLVRIAPECSGCRKFICEACAKDGRCRPWEKQLDEIEARARMLNSLGV